jgi:hypothetical protein
MSKTFIEYLSEARFDVISKEKTKDGRKLHHTVEIASKTKIDVDDVATKVGYPPMAYGLSKSKVTKLDNGNFKYEWDSASNAG